MKTPAKFDFKQAVIDKASYPTGKVSVFLDGYKAQELRELSADILDKEQLVKTLTAQDTGIVGDPEVEALVPVIEELKERQKTLIEEIETSRITFHLRGVVPAVWRAIVKKANASNKPNDKTNEEDVHEANVAANNQVNWELVAHAITKVENADGAVDDSGLKSEDVESLWGSLIESEWHKLLGKVNELTFANALFDQVAEKDADFLPKR